MKPKDKKYCKLVKCKYQDNCKFDDCVRNSKCVIYWNTYGKLHPADEVKYDLDL